MVSNTALPEEILCWKKIFKTKECKLCFKMIGIARLENINHTSEQQIEGVKNVNEEYECEESESTFFLWSY